MDEKVAVASLAALAQGMRLRVFRALVGAAPEGMTPGVLAATLDVPASTLDTQAADTTCLWLVQITAAGVVSMKKGVEELNTDLAAGKRVLHWPEPDADNCPVGAVKVKTVGTAFVPDTDSFAETWVTDTYYDFIGGMPVEPLTS